MSKNEKDLKLYNKRRRIIAVISLAVVAILMVLLSVFVYRWLKEFSADDFRDYINGYGAAGWLVLLGLQFLQVFIALIPGEILETACGYVLGPFFGTVICYAGVALASALIFYLTRKLGSKFTEIFVSTEKINELKFIKNKEKRKRLIFILYLIPATPKDMITYFVGLTDTKLSEFLIISLFARLPSVVSSTVGGHLIGEKNYLAAILLYAITGAVGLCGIFIYKKIAERKGRQGENKDA